MPKPAIQPTYLLLPFALLFLAATLIAQPVFYDNQSSAKPGKPVQLKINTTNCNRDAIVADYIISIDSSVVSNAELNWTGDVATCTPGTISSAAMQKTLIRVNYFRRLVGVRDSITWRADWSAKCQEAALMFKANNMLSHTPPTNWLCYTANAAQAAGSSNISIGPHSSGAINQYIQDAGTNNTAAGHRRWILYTKSTEFGFGSTNSSTDLWVIGSFQTPDTIPEYIAYPTAGYFPKPLVYDRWSFAVPGGNFASSTVEMFDENNTPLAVTLEPLATGYGDNTIVWTAVTGTMPPVLDKLFKVKISNVLVSGQPKSYTYNVLCINPTKYAIAINTVQPTCGASNGSIKLSYPPGYKKIEWSNGVVGQDSIFGLAAGTYYASITDALDCIKMDTIELLDSSTPATAGITHPGDLNICPGEQLELTATGGTGYHWSTNANTPAITVSAGGSYTVTVTNAFGCSGTATVQVVQGAGAPVSITPAGATQFCAGQSVQLVASGGVSYLWSTGASDSTVTVGSAGSFTVTATNALGCTGTAVQAIVVEANPPVAINPSGLVQLCPDESVELTASGGVSYAWNTGAGNPAITVNTSGDFTVTATNAFGCTATMTQSVVVQANLSVSIALAGSAQICAGQSVELTASGGNTYQWSTGAGDPAITVDAAGNYTVTATNAFGCTGTAVQTVVVNANPVVSITPAGATELCPGQSVELTAGGGLTYAWNTGAGDPAITVNTSGDFTVTATNAFGCTTTATQPVVVHPNPTVSIIPAGPTTFCAGQQVQLTAGGGATYQWSTGAATAAITATTAGTYTVTATNAFGCTASTTQAIAVNAAPIVSIAAAGPTEFCAGQSVQLTASGGSSYQWSNSSATPTIDVNTSGNFTVTATNAAGCTSSATRNVVAFSNISVSITPSGATEFCSGQIVNLAASGGATYAWSNGASGPGLNVSVSGTYTVTATNAIGCTGSASQTVTVLPKPNVWIAASGPTQLCQGQTLSLIAIGNDAYQWSTGSGDKIIEVSTAGTYTVTATNAAGCSSTASQTVTVVPTPTVSITVSGPTAFCQGGSVKLTATGSGTFSWSNGVNSASITVVTAGAYTVTASNGQGCIATASQTVEIHEAPTAAINPPGVIGVCAGKSAQITASGGGAYHWNTGANEAILTVSTAGTYSVTVTNTGGCTATATSQVVLNPSPVIASISGNKMAFQNGMEVYSVANNPGSYIWQVSGGTIAGGANTNAITVHWADGNSGQVCVTEIDQNGCKSDPFCTDVSLELFVGTTENPDDAHVEIAPNPFSDQVHVRFAGKNLPLEKCRVRIFSTQGVQVFAGTFETTEFTIDLSAASAGLYFIECSAGDKKVLAKLVKQ